MLMEIDGISITVTKKAIKTLRLTVKAPEGRVSLSAPLSLSDARIRLFVSGKLDWIQAQQEKFALCAPQAEPRFVAGETLFVWGRPYCLQWETGARNCLRLEGDAAILTRRGESTAAQREKQINEWYRGILKAEIARTLPDWERAMGLSCSGWQIKNMKTRWGSCNVKTKKIWLNLRLAKNPPDCLQYVLVHELAHLKERRHNARFAAIVAQYLPNWRESKAQLSGGNAKF